MLKRKAEPGQISKRNSNGGNHCFISKENLSKQQRDSDALDKE